MAMEVVCSVSLPLPSPTAPEVVEAAALRSLQIWWSIPHTLNKWIAGAVPIPDHSPLFTAAHARLPTQQHAPTVRLRRFVVKDETAFAAEAMVRLCVWGLREWCLGERGCVQEMQSIEVNSNGVAAKFIPLPLDVGESKRFPATAHEYCVFFRFHFDEPAERLDTLESPRLPWKV